MTFEGVKKVEPAAGLFFWTMLYAFILSYLHPELIFSESLPAGGDMAGHYPTAVFLKERLFSQGRIVGWEYGNYAGFPQFQLYFPLPFIMIVVLSFAISMPVAFKIVSIAGVLTLPVAAFHFLRSLDIKDPGPHLGALFSLSFLFMEANSAWGGNITSTLAGEFTYGIGLSLSLVYLGRLFRDIDEKKNALSNAALLAAVGFSHGYTLLFCVSGASFFLFTTRKWTSRLAYILKVNILAFCFMGFWIVPLIAFMPYTTPFHFAWIINDWKEVLPLILLPFIVWGPIGFLYGLIIGRAGEERQDAFIVFLAAVGLVFYLIAYKIGVVDTRFLPFIQIMIVLFGAAGLGRLLGFVTLKRTAVLALALFSLFWIAHQVNVIDKWTEWNYGGLEEKPLWKSYEAVNGHLRGDFGDPRVVYEHSPLTEGAGTIRAFENLPFFSGRATLEGLYIQASLSAPAVFYIQSEVSPLISSPLSQINYARFDLERALTHLSLFNVDSYITVSRDAKNAALNTPGMSLDAEYPPFSIFKIHNRGGGYVIQPDYRPVLAITEKPAEDGFQWFRFTDGAVPLVFSNKVDAEDKADFAAILDGVDYEAPADLPKEKLAPAKNLKVDIRKGEIVVNGAEPGRPLWIKYSFHPNWKVEGAKKVWRTAPSFMMVFPTDGVVRLYFGKSWPNYLGLLLTFVSLIYAMALIIFNPDKNKADMWELGVVAFFRPFSRLTANREKMVLAAGSVFLIGVILSIIFLIGFKEPTVMFNRGRSLFADEKYKEAREVLTEAASLFPYSPIIDQTIHHKALTWFKEGEYRDAMRIWLDFEKRYPESRLLPEVLYHIGLCYAEEGDIPEAVLTWTYLEDRFSGNIWSEHAHRRLDETLKGGLD